MTQRVLLASLAAGALTVPLSASLPVSSAVSVSSAASSAASSAVDELAIREIIVRPESPVIRATGSVRLVIDVIARGAEGKGGVTIKVEPGSPRKPRPAPTLVSPTPSPVSPTPVVASPTPSPAVRADLEPQVVDGGWETAYPQRRGADNWETWRFLPARGLNRYYPTGPWTITATAKGADGQVVTDYATFRLRHETRLATVRPQKVKGARAVRLRGQLSRVDPNGATSYAPFARQPVEILYRGTSTGAWRKLGTVTTRASGKFGKSVPGLVKGFWRARYAGTDHYATDESLPWRIGR